MNKIMKCSHNKTNLVYHLLCAVKYRKEVLDSSVTTTIVSTCLGIQEKYNIQFIEIGTDVNCIHFLLQAPPKYSPTQIVTIVKSITARKVFERHPEVKRQLWGGEFWSDGYWMVTVSRNAFEKEIKDYVSNKGNGKYRVVLKKNNL